MGAREKICEEELEGAVIALLKALDDSQRLKVFAKFCVYCGCDDPKCQCWNDE